MGNSYVKLINQTPYEFTYCYSYFISLNTIKGNGIIGPHSEIQHNQMEYPSHLYVKYGRNNCLNDTRHRPDLHRSYNGRDNPTFFIRVCDHDQAHLELRCNRGGDVPICINHGMGPEGGAN
ncbi:hypothetical protein XENTR_v10022002 [Xenopus tropicalis]|nr:hypothetical protein XENTR_v10022002 [Xenopus tropicalis]